MKFYSKDSAIACTLFLVCSLIFIPALHAGNDVLGQIDLVGASKVERTSGVWIDGQYVGYLRELKGSKKLLLLPGEHEIAVRQGGYLDFVQKVTVRGRRKADHRSQDGKRYPGPILPQITARSSLDVKPNRAAVFVDGVFVGHVAEFERPGQGPAGCAGKAQN